MHTVTAHVTERVDKGPVLSEDDDDGDDDRRWVGFVKGAMSLKFSPWIRRKEEVRVWRRRDDREGQ